jgi:hypothetical protein
MGNFINMLYAVYQWLMTIRPINSFLIIGLPYSLFMVLYKAGKNSLDIKEYGLTFEIPASPLHSTSFSDPS